MLAAFFMPWFGLEGVGLSGFQVAKLGLHELGSDVGPVWLVWLIPITAGITLFVSVQGMSNRGWGFLAGFTPIAGFAYVFVKITGNSGEQGMRDAFEIFKHAFAVGSYLTLGTAVAIIIASCQSASDATAPSECLGRTFSAELAPEEKRAVGSGDDQLSQLERLARLRDSGVLTPEEFEAQKKRLLG
jgi:hypothetical protein